MSKKSIYWGILLLLLFPAVVTADNFDEEDDYFGSAIDDDETDAEENFGDNAEPAVTENAAKTWKHTMSVSVKNREPVSPNNEINVETDVDIKTGSYGKDFMRVKDTISFSFYLPYKARIRVKCALNDECTGKAVIQWNSRTLRDEYGNQKKFTFDGSNASFEIPNLEANSEKNTLTFVCTDGEIGLESLTIYADIEYPSFEFNGLRIQLTSPRPGDPLNGDPVSICWEVTKGLAQGGWVKVLYCTPDTGWQVVPGLEGVTYGTQNWGNFVWENPPKAKSCKFKIEYKRGENPVDKQRAEAEYQRMVVTAAAKELIQTKKKFLDDVDGLLPSSVWQNYLEDMRNEHQTLKSKLRKSLKEENLKDENKLIKEENLKDENKLNLQKVVQNIDALEQCYFTAFMRLMKIAPTIDDEKERSDIQSIVNKFEEMVGQEFSNASEDYGDDEYAKVLIPKMFPKERFAQFKEAKKVFDNALKTPESLKGPIVDLIKAKMVQLNAAINAVPLSYWSKYFGDSRTNILKLKAQVEVAIEDKENKNIEKTFQNIDELDRLYSNMLLELMEKAPDNESKEELGQVLNLVEKYQMDFLSAKEKANVRFGNQDGAGEMLALLFANERYNAIQTAKESFKRVLESSSSKPGTQSTSQPGIQSTPQPGTRRVWTVNGVEFAFRWCPAGTFMMGSPETEEGHTDFEMLHQVTLTRGFWMMETEVTQKQWKAIMGTNPSEFKGDDLPVECVSWKECQAFCYKCRQLKLPVQLPTEAQWEYACRAGSASAFSWGNSLNGNQANCDGTQPYGMSTQGKYLQRTTPVGSYTPNAWGIYDMHGNVWEWCQDGEDVYPNGGVIDPVVPSNNDNHICRGGCWYGCALLCRSACRCSENEWRDILGFRVVIVQ